MRYPPVVKSVLVTGCSSGIGLATADRLRKHGWTVYPTARKTADLEALQARGFTAIALDVADSDSVERAARRVLDLTGGNLGALVNNAGFGQPGAVEDLTRDALRYQFEVNLFGLQQLTRAFIPGFRERGAGRIVNVSSVVGRIALPMLGAYCASKFALEALSDAQRVELRGAGIALSLVEPGPIHSAFRENALRQADANVTSDDSPFGRSVLTRVMHKEGIDKAVSVFKRPPDAVARKIRHALESRRPHRRYCVTLPAHAGAWLRRFAPYALLDALMANRVKRLCRDPQAARGALQVMNDDNEQETDHDT